MYSDRARYAQNVNESKTGSDVKIISTLSNPVMFGTVGFVPKRCIKNIELWDYIVSFSGYCLFLNRK